MVPENDELEFNLGKGEEKKSEEKKAEVKSDDAESKGKKGTAAPEIMSNIAMQKMMLEMAAELKYLRENKQPQVAQATQAGMSTEQFGELVKLLKAPQDNGFENPYVDNANIPADDYDEVGVMFTSYSGGTIIVDDIRKGVPVQTPRRNKIFFDYQGTIKNQNGKYVDTHMFCAYTSHSKVEQAWLREHSHYGLKIFESVKEALSADYKKAAKMAKVLVSVGSMDQQQIMSSCRSKGIPMIDDLQKMKIMLAQNIVDGEMALEKGIVPEALLEREALKDLIDK